MTQPPLPEPSTPVAPSGDSNVFDTVKDLIINAPGTIMEKVQSGDPIFIIGACLIGAIAIYLIYFYGSKMYRSINSFRKGSPYIFEKTKDARRRVIISQNPSKEGSVTLPRSSNEKGGIEFSYSTWLFIDNYNYKLGQWKHVFHKGNDSSWPLRAPGVWLHPTKNALRVYMNSYDEIADYVDIENIPINKWFSLIMVMRGQTMDIYINGNVKKSFKLNSIPKQNYGDVYINAFGGFSGYLSRLRYYDYALNYSEIDAVNKAGPNLMPVAENNENPPYLTANWWTND
jgi:hypothetical protein